MVETLESVEVKGIEGKTGKAMLDAIVGNTKLEVQGAINLQLCDCVSQPCVICIAQVYEPRAQYTEAKPYPL